MEINSCNITFKNILISDIIIQSNYDFILIKPSDLYLENYFNYFIWLNCTLSNIFFGKQKLFLIKDQLTNVIFYQSLFSLVAGNENQQFSIFFILESHFHLSNRFHSI